MERPIECRKALGEHLRLAREALGLSFSEVEKITDGTAAVPYVRALESGEVKFPAPHVLFYLAGAYVISYEKLMEMAEHIRPKRLTGEVTACPHASLHHPLASGL